MQSTKRITRQQLHVKSRNNPVISNQVKMTDISASGGIKYFTSRPWLSDSFLTTRSVFVAVTSHGRKQRPFEWFSLRRTIPPVKDSSLPVNSIHSLDLLSPKEDSYSTHSRFYAFSKIKAVCYLSLIWSPIRCLNLFATIVIVCWPLQIVLKLI